MARALSLAAYLALARRRRSAPHGSNIPRPDGQLIWAHASNSTHADAMIQMFARLAAQRPGTSAVLTTPAGEVHPTAVKSPSLWIELGEDSVTQAQIFLDHWRPDCCIWTGGAFMPALICEAHDRNLPLYLVDGSAEKSSSQQSRWLPDLTPALLDKFDGIMARDATTAGQFRRLGLGAEDLRISGPLIEGTQTLHYNDQDRDDILEAFQGRPVWLAAMVQPEEMDIVLTAHLRARRYAHRLLLVIVPDDETQGDRMRAEIEARDWRVARWSEGEYPDETTQVLLADTRGDMGLWYRVCPITFMGSSLTANHAGRDPNEPAAHGSAILYGPNVRRYMSGYSRFAGVGGARIVRDSETLAAAVQALLAPDRAASMSLAAWDVATQSARVMDHILNLVQDTLDVLEES